MAYRIFHQIIYRYDRPVVLAPHVLRLRPRCDVTQRLRQFVLRLDPEPQQLYESLDLDGNAIFKARFAEQGTEQLLVEVVSEVETFRHNPFAYLLEPWATTLPLDYPALLLHQLQPYRGGQFAGGFDWTLDPTAFELAQELWLETGGGTVAFLTALNQKIYQSCGYEMREVGKALPPGLTWAKKSGSCRDYAVLFMEVCRAAGLASRFVSGYQEGDPDSNDRHLHAWAEVYLPGAGWRGYDPTHGLAVADGHIALVATPTAAQSAPVEGALKTVGAQSEMSYRLKIEILPD